MYRKTADEIMELDPEIAIIPVGSLEQHGPHLPVMTDWAIATALGQRVAEKMGAFLVPAIPVFVTEVKPGEYVRMMPIDGMFENTDAAKEND